MNVQKLRWGDWIAGIAGLDLALVTFRAWYKVSGTGAKVTAWDGLTHGRYLLIATAVVGVFLLLIVASEQTAELSFPPGAIAGLVGLACTVYVGYRLASPPSDAADPDIGLYFGLASALGVCIGGLLSMREGEPVAAYVPPEMPTEAAPAWQPGGTTPPELGGPAPAGWSPAPPAAESTWTPAPPAAGPPGEPGTGGAQAGDQVRLTAGGARFPAGTIATIVQVFGGGALVEVTAPDGVAERFEVPQAAYEPVGAAPPTQPATSGEAWSPAMPAAAEPGAAPPAEDWGFGEAPRPAGDGAAGVPGEEPPAEAEAEAAAAEKKVPWWKRDIGGGKKKEEAAVAEAETAALADEEEARPGLFKRLFGGGKAAEAEPEAAGDGGWTVPGEPEAGEVEPEAAAPEPEPPAPEPEPEPPAPEPEPEPPAPEPEPEPEPPAPEPEPVAVEPEPEPPAPEPEPEPPAPAPEPAPEPVAVEPEPEPPAPEPEPEPPAPEPEPEPPAPEPEAEAAAEEPEAAPEPPKKRRRSSGSRKVPQEALDAQAGEAPAAEPEEEPAAPEAAAEPVAEAAESDEAPKKRRRSSGSRKVPKEVLDAVADEAPPKVGDEVELKVAGGRWDAGTRGTVVDVFSAGVIVEIADDDGKTERLDLPFEAVSPASAGR